MPRQPSEALLFARQHAAKAGLHPKTIVQRLRLGWSPQEAAGEQERPRLKPGRKTSASLCKDYASRYHASRRAIARANGICVSCNADKVEAGKSQCPGCRQVDRIRHQERKAA